MRGITADRRRRLVLGIGNPERGDDAAGRAVARLLRGALPDDVEIIELDGEATALLAHFEGAAAAFVIDACASGAAAGTVRRFDVGTALLPRAVFGMSTHGFGLAEAVELARSLGELPPHCVVYAIEGNSFDAGAPMSPAVTAAVVAVAGRLRAEILSDERTNGRNGGMHEASLMASLMRRIDEAAKAERASRVVGVSVWLGALSHLSVEHFAEHFERAAAGTIAEGARLDARVSNDFGHVNAQDILLEKLEMEV